MMDLISMSPTIDSYAGVSSFYRARRYLTVCLERFYCIRSCILFSSCSSSEEPVEVPGLINVK